MSTRRDHTLRCAPAVARGGAATGSSEHGGVTERRSEAPAASNLATSRGARATFVPPLRRTVSCRVSRRPWPTATSLKRLPKLSSFVLRPASKKMASNSFRGSRAGGRPTVAAAARGPRLIEASGARRLSAAAARRPAGAPGRSPAARRSSLGARIHKDSRGAVLTSWPLLLDRPRCLVRCALTCGDREHAVLSSAARRVPRALS